MIDPSDVKEGRINDQLETQLESLSAQVEANLEMSRNTLSECSRSVDDLVHHRPWEMAAAGLAFGLMLGFLLSRR